MIQMKKKRKKRNDTNELIYKTEIDPHTQKTNMVTKEDIMGRDKLEFGISRHTLLHIK